jgi:hypothetical protein
VVHKEGSVSALTKVVNDNELIRPVNLDYTTSYDGTKILRQNCVYTVSQAKGTFISAGIPGVVERLQDGIGLKFLLTKKGLGPYNRLVPMLGYSAEGLVLEYMENGTLKVPVEAS